MPPEVARARVTTLPPRRASLAGLSGGNRPMKLELTYRLGGLVDHVAVTIILLNVNCSEGSVPRWGVASGTFFLLLALLVGVSVHHVTKRTLQVGASMMSSVLSLHPWTSLIILEQEAL